MAAVPIANAKSLSIVLILALLTAPVSTTLWAKNAPNIGYQIVERYPHHTAAFTEGLEVVDGALYESSGLYRESFVARWHLDGSPGNESQAPFKRDIAAEYFAEGITVFGDKAYLLTWQSGKGFVLNAESLHIERSFEYSGEGWGLTHDHESLIMSDGTARLRFLNPKTLREEKSLDVTENGKPLTYLNELEWIDAGVLSPQPRLLANIWQTDQVAVIDPQTGVVTARLDLSKLYPSRRRGEDVMNGIAFDPADNTLLVTGKRWRYLWRLRTTTPLP